jgi:hypothetical protein
MFDCAHRTLIDPDSAGQDGTPTRTLACCVEDNQQQHSYIWIPKGAMVDVMKTAAKISNIQGREGEK